MFAVVIAKSAAVRLSVRPSVCRSQELHVNRSRFHYITKYSAGLTTVPVVPWEGAPAARGPRSTANFYHAVLRERGEEERGGEGPLPCVGMGPRREWLIRPWQNNIRYRNAFYTTRYSDVSSFFRPNFVVVSLGILPERVY